MLDCMLTTNRVKHPGGGGGAPSAARPKAGAPCAGRLAPGGLPDPEQQPCRLQPRRPTGWRMQALPAWCSGSQLYRFQKKSFRCRLDQAGPVSAGLMQGSPKRHWQQHSLSARRCPGGRPRKRSMLHFSVGATCCSWPHAALLAALLPARCEGLLQMLAEESVCHGATCTQQHASLLSPSSNCLHLGFRV